MVIFDFMAFVFYGSEFSFWLIMRHLRRLNGNTRVLSVVLEYPDLPPIDNATMEYIERLTATPSNLEFGSLSHYVHDQSHGRANLKYSTVERLGGVLPAWSALYDLPANPGDALIEKKSFSESSIIAHHFGKRLLRYDMVIVLHGGRLPWNAVTVALDYTIGLGREGLSMLQYTIKLPTIRIGLPVLEGRMTSSICHELHHALGPMDHAPFLDGEEGTNENQQRNPWRSLGGTEGWGQTDPYFHTLSIGMSAYNCNRLGWYKPSEVLRLTAPFINQTVLLRATGMFPVSAPASSVYLCEIDTSALANHGEGYVLEARTKQGYDLGIYDSGVLIHKLALLTNFPTLGPFPFLLGSAPLGPEFQRWVLTSGEVFSRGGLEVSITDVILGANGVPEVYELNVTVQ